MRKKKRKRKAHTHTNQIYENWNKFLLIEERREYTLEISHTTLYLCIVDINFICCYNRAKSTQTTPTTRHLQIVSTFAVYQHEKEITHNACDNVCARYRMSKL